MQAIERYKIANCFPVGEQASFSQIAQKRKLNEDDTKRVLRQAIAYYIFEELKKGYVAHTAISRQIAEPPQIQDYISVHVTELWRSAPFTVAAMEKWPGLQELQHTGWALANNTELSMPEGVVEAAGPLAKGARCHGNSRVGP